MLQPSRLAVVSAFLASCATADKYGNNYLSVQRDSDIVAANFPDVDVPLLSPAFLQPETIPPGFRDGTKGPTDDAVLDEFVKSIADKHDWATYHVADFTSEEGKPFPHLTLSTSPPRSPCRRAVNGTQKVRVWLQGAMHGNEPAGDQAVLAFLGALSANTTWALSLLERLDIMVLPRYNVDGVGYFQRTLATNFDPNRDHVKLARQQTRRIKKMLSEFAPHVAIDMHEYGASTRYGNYVHASDALFSAAKNLNIHPEIRRMSEELFAVRMGEALERRGLRWEPYITSGASSRPGLTRFLEAGSDGKIGRNAMGLTQCITFLCETRGIRLADQQFQRRTVAGLTMIEGIVQTAADNADAVYSTVEGSIRDFKRSNGDIVLTDSSSVIDRTFTMIDANNGSIVQMPVEFAVTTPVVANLTRPRPEAYLIPVAWADLAARLIDSGVEVQTLEEPYTGTVQALDIVSTRFATGYYEGVVRVTAVAETGQREVALPKGSFLVSTRQKNAALAFVALEPENIDSYVSFNIVPVERGDEYPIYRIMS